MDGGTADADVPVDDPGRRRFTVAALIGLGLVTIPFVWILTDLWTGSASLTRTVSPSNFYDLQGRAILGGHLYLPNGSIGIEAFVNKGHQYTYFGLFPSLIRLPVLAVTHSLDGRLTAFSMLLAWVAAGSFATLLFWRIRLRLRGSVPLGSAEAVACGALLAVTSGSVLFYIASSPQSSYEDLAWSIALTIGVLFALVGVAESPGWRRIAGAGLLLLCATLDRSTTGYACILAALAIAIWLGLGREGSDRRKGALPLAIIGGACLVVSGVIAWAKLGSPFGLSLSNQVWTGVNAHRRAFLAANGGSAFGLHFLPSTLNAYWRPFGLSLSSHFPFLSIPTTPARPVGGVVLDQLLPTASVPASMPLLFLLSCWGTVATFRPRTAPGMKLLRILWLAMAAAASGVLLYGATIAERYLADFVPFLALASMIGLIDLWTRLERVTVRSRAVVVAAVLVLGGLGIWINIGGAITPSALWTPTQAKNYVSFQRSLGGAPRALRGNTLPNYEPGGTLFDIGDCSGLYISNGFDVSYIPGKALQHDSWTPVEQPSGSIQVLDVTLHGQVGEGDGPLTIATYGRSVLQLVPTGINEVKMVLDGTGLPGTVWPPNTTGRAAMQPGTAYRFVIETDPHLRSMTAAGLGLVIQHYVPGVGPLEVASDSQGHSPSLTTEVTYSSGSSKSLCRDVVGGK